MSHHRTSSFGSSSSQLRCLQKSTAGLCPENNVRLWSRKQDLTTYQRFSHLLSSIGCYGQSPARSFPRLLSVCFWVSRFWVGGTLFDECNTSITTSHKSRAGTTSIRKPDREMMVVRQGPQFQSWEPYCAVFQPS